MAKSTVFVNVHFALPLSHNNIGLSFIILFARDQYSPLTGIIPKGILVLPYVIYGLIIVNIIPYFL